MSLTSVEEIKESLSVFAITVNDDDVLFKLQEIALLFKYDADSLVDEWLAYQSTHNCGLTLPDLEKLLIEKKCGKNRIIANKTPISARKRKPLGVYTSENFNDFFDMHIEGMEDDVLDAYGTPDCVKKTKKPNHVTPKSALKSRHGIGNILDDSPMFSPSSISPTRSSQKYGVRQNPGEVLIAFGDDLKSFENHPKSKNLNISIACNKNWNVQKTYKYMFQKVLDLSDVMNETIETLAELISKRYADEIDVFAPCSLPSQEPVFIVGRVCCDQGGGVGKLNSDSVILQGDRATSYGDSVSVDLSQIDEYSLFPGQIIAMQGTNPTGKKFIATKIFTPGIESCNNSNTITDCGPTHVLIASGPFTTSDSLSFEPLTDLISTVKEKQPDVTILIGPLVDGKNDEVKNGRLTVPFQELHQKQIDLVIEELKGCTKLVFVSSQRDVCSHPVYPQPPYTPSRQSQNVTLVGDPSQLQINGLHFAVTSNDILLHLGAEETCRVKGMSDRFSRLSSHILDQRSLYPLMPSHETVNIDWIAAEVYGCLITKPHFLILPSDLKCFVKDIDGCVCINPGRLSKGMTGGSFAEILVEKFNEDNVTACTNARVVRI